MFTPGSERRRQAICLQGMQHGRHLRLAEHRLLKGLDVANPAHALGNIGRHCGLEGAAADKDDNRVHRLRADLQHRLQCLQVLVVLVNRVLELKTLLVNLLRPPSLLFTAEDPAAHVLRLQHEEAEGRNKHMVDLRSAVRGDQRYVMQAAVDLTIQ